MKSFMKKLAAVAAACAVAVPFAACGTEHSGEGGTKALAKATDVYAFSAVTAVGLLPEAATPAMNARGRFYAAPADEAAPAETDPLESRIEEVNQYLNLFEGMLGSGAIRSEISTDPADTTYGEGESAVTYANRMSIRVAGLDGKTETYVFYFDEVKTDESSDAVLDGDGEEEQVTETERESEVSSKLSGIMVRGESVYEVTGEKKVETEEETEDGETETEKETSVKFVAKAESGASVVVEQSTEEETEDGKTELEQSFVYTVRDEDNRVVGKSKVNVEEEEDETEISLELTENGVKSRYKFEREGDRIKIHYTDADGKFVAAKVRVITDEEGNTSYEYEFPSGRIRHGDRDDD